MDTDRSQQPDSNSQNTQVEPDTEAGLPSPKRPRLELGEGKKVRVLTALIEAYAAICKNLKLTEEMMNANMTTSHQVTIIMSSLHNICWSKTNGSNASKNTTPTTFTVNSEGNLFTATTESLIGLWTKTLENNGLQYRAFATDDCDNWLGKMSAYLNSSETFKLRLNEMRLGYKSMVVSTEGPRTTWVSLSEYWLCDAFYPLLEGITYSPERRLVMKHSVGPMTALLCMVQSEGKQRKKWEEIVRRTMSLISCIDDVINITKEIKSKLGMARMVSIIGYILLITSPERATRMHFPMCMLYRIHSQSPVENRVALLKRFSCSGPGAFYLYKQCHTDSMKWVIEGNYTPEQAAQLVFHSIFGTFKENFTILEQITNVKTWFTRHQFKECFKKTEECTGVEFTLPELRLYPKVTAVKPRDFLSTDLTDIQPISSGGMQMFSQDFLDQFQGNQVELAIAARRIEDILCDIYQLRDRKVTENKPIKDLGTTSWRTMASLTLTEDGTETQHAPVAGRKYFSTYFIDPN